MFYKNIFRNNNCQIFASCIIRNPGAVELNPMLCTLHHIKAPLVWAVCGLPLRDFRGRRKQISFLDLGPSFPSIPQPSSPLPFIWPLQGSAGWQHASAVLHSRDVFRWETHISLMCILENEVFEFSLFMRLTGCGQDDYQAYKYHVQDAGQKSNFEKIEEVQETKQRVFHFFGSFLF